jgi:HlyD family secretion protein
VTAVVALGRIVPEGEVIKLSVSNAEDSRVNQILVKEGDFVQANQVIALLQGIDRRKADLRDAEAEVRLRQAELAKAKQGDAKQAELVAQQALINRQSAQLRAETRQKQAAIASAKATLREAQLSYQRQRALAQEGAIGRADVDIAQRDFETAQATLREKQADLEQTLTTLQADIAQERAKLAALQEVRPVDVEITQAQLEKARIAVEQAKADLDDAQVRVPVAGRILRINTQVGEQVNISEGIVELAQTDQMYAIAEVSETDITKVRQGQRATIFSEYGGLKSQIKGTVEQISLQTGRKTLQDPDSSSSTAQNPTTDQDARIVEVKVRIDPEDSPKVAAQTNLQVQVKIDITPSKR